MKCSNFSKSVCWPSLIRTVKAGFFNEVLLIQSLFYSKGELELWGCQKNISFKTTLALKINNNV